MYKKKYDAVRLRIVLNKIDDEIDRYFRNKYVWYSSYYNVMQLMNILRILPYAHEKNVIAFLKETLEDILYDICKKENFGIGNNASNGSAGVELNNVSKVESPNTRFSKPRTLIVPVAADKLEYESGLPYVFGLDKDGVIICIKSIMGLDLENFDNIYFTILRKHDERFFVSESLKLQFKHLGIKNAHVVVLDEPTKEQAETICRTIEQKQIRGGIFIKDADSFFHTNINYGNAIALFPIEQLDVLTPKDKSYVAIDDMYYLTNIIEKKVVGHYISAGGYAIYDAETFLYYYRRLRPYGRIYLSHIIYAMLLDKITFRPMIVEEYKDWGTIKDFKRYELSTFSVNSLPML